MNTNQFSSGVGAAFKDDAAIVASLINFGWDIECEFIVEVIQLKIKIIDRNW